VIFDVIISTTVQEFCNLRPLVPVLHMQLQDFIVFFLAPAVFLYVWIQVVVPSFAALLSDSAFQVIGNLTPILSAVKPHLLDQKSVFFFCPGTLYHLRIQNFLPTMQTLHVSPLIKSFCYALPILGSHLLY
jgi:hypothetical protein